MRARCLLVVALLVVAAPGGVARAQPGASVPVRALPAAAERISPGPTLARLHAAARAISSGSLARAVGTAADLAGVVPDAHRRARGEVRVGLPGARLPKPVAALLTAVLSATATARGAIHGDPAELRAVFGRLVLARNRIAMHPDDPGARADVRRLGRFENRVDRRRLLSAAMILARAIDANGPSLEALARTSRSPGTPAADGCDMLDAVPALCVGTAAGTTFTTDAALLIDMGGDDTYRNSAGGADPADNKLPVSVVIDLGGNDTYDSPVPAASGALAVQGSGYLGGVGFLVDEAGDDSYTAAATAAGAQVSAQATSFAGVGVLADLAGNDDYRASTLGLGDLLAEGQATSILAGAAILRDAAGDDTYLTQSHPAAWVDANGKVHGAGATSNGAGDEAFGSVVLFADEAGKDSISSDAASGHVPADESREFDTTDLAGVVANGGGSSGAGGTALVITGEGSTTWDMRSTTTVPFTDPLTATGVNAFGYAAAGGVGALLDQGGSDVYDASASATADVRRTIDDTCECDGVTAEATLANAHAGGQGMGSTGSIGVLEDEGGNDVYSMTAATDAHTVAVDHRTHVASETPGQEVVPALADAETSFASILAQGSGQFGGAGFLLDRGGDDAYTAHASTRAVAEATSDVDPNGVSAYALTGRAVSEAQAVGDDLGFGELVDSGGTDSYSAESTSSAITQPPDFGIAGETGSVVQAGSTSGAEGGLGAALFIDTGDGGAPDTFRAMPARPACMGTRGGESWQDCGGPAFGFNRETSIRSKRSSSGTGWRP